MAEHSIASEISPDSNSHAIDLLRNVAQKHLEEIDEERTQEQIDEDRKMHDLQRYAKHKRREKEGADASIGATSLPRMRTAQDVLHRLQWDTGLDVSQYLIGYLERFEGIKEIPAQSWISESTDEEWIPQHRIKYFKRISDGAEHEIVWDRESRVDKIFNTGVGPNSVDTTDSADIVSEDGGVRIPS